MKFYELVTVIDANLSAKDIKEVSAKVEELFGKSIVDADAIGLLPTAYPVEGQDQAYYMSYHIEIDPDTIPQLKQDMSIMKWLVKYTIFGMSANESFMKMQDLKKRYEEMNSVEEEEAEEEEQSEESEENA